MTEKSRAGAAGLEDVGETIDAREGALPTMGATGGAGVARGVSRGDGITLRSGAGAAGFDGAASVVDVWEDVSPIAGAFGGGVARFTDDRWGADK